MFRDFNRLAVGWNALLEAGLDAPQSLLGMAIKDLCFSGTILGRPETQVAVGKLLTQIYPFLTRSDRGRVGKVTMRIPDEIEEDLKEYGIDRRNRILGCLPVELIETATARSDPPRTGGNQQGPKECASRFEIGGWRTVGEEEELEESGVPIQAPQNMRFRTTLDQVRKFGTPQPSKPSIGELRSTLAGTPGHCGQYQES